MRLRQTAGLTEEARPSQSVPCCPVDGPSGELTIAIRCGTGRRSTGPRSGSRRNSNCIPSDRSSEGAERPKSVRDGDGLDVLVPPIARPAVTSAAFPSGPPQRPNAASRRDASVRDDRSRRTSRVQLHRAWSRAYNPKPGCRSGRQAGGRCEPNTGTDAFHAAAGAGEAASKV